MTVNFTPLDNLNTSTSTDEMLIFVSLDSTEFGD